MEYRKATAMIKNVHFDKGDTVDTKLAVVRKLIDSWRLKSAEANLFLFYASKPSGYKPHEDEITRETGIIRNNISRTRNKLAERKLIQYDDKKNTITLDWSLLKALCWIPDDMNPRKGEILPYTETKLPNEEKRLRELYGLDLPDVNPNHLTFGCMLKPYTEPPKEKMEWLPEEDGDRPVLKEAGVLETYELPF